MGETRDEVGAVSTLCTLRSEICNENGEYLCGIVELLWQRGAARDEVKQSNQMRPSGYMQLQNGQPAVSLCRYEMMGLRYFREK